MQTLDPKPCTLATPAGLCRDRKGGRDHIILEAHDEGSCVIPAVLRPAIILSHW